MLVYKFTEITFDKIQKVSEKCEERKLSLYLLGDKYRHVSEFSASEAEDMIDSATEIATSSADSTLTALADLPESEIYGVAITKDVVFLRPGSEFDM